MDKVAIVVDSNSGITPQEAKKYNNIFIIPMPFMIDGEEYFESVSINHEEFYSKMAQNLTISTSQPAIGQVVELWEEILQNFETIVHIPMSSALSKECETAQIFARNYPDKVFVVDNKRISVTQKKSVENALKLIDKGMTAKEIKEYLERTWDQSSIYISLDTLKYLKKGGRITPAAAAIGTLLKIKPVLKIEGGKLDRYAIARNEKVARMKMIEAMKKDFETKFKEYVDNGEMEICLAYSDDKAKVEDFAVMVKEEIPNVPVTLIEPLPLSIACHIGGGAIGFACSRVIK